ncbi:hypothetical protein JAAARDRAFT_142635, partial [Jaapia argillacea MUCL 33604]
QKEVNVWKDLRHPNIVEFYGYNYSSAPMFLLSSLKEEGDALTFLLSNPDANRAKPLYDVSLGLQYLHSHSIVHADLKALNILVDKHGIACLCDFGLSLVRMHTTSNTSNSINSGGQGTLRWMAPEQMDGGRATLKSDIYSFGMTIYEASCIQQPNFVII